MTQLWLMAAGITFCAIASLGLPGLAGFWGEMLALFGSYNPASPLDPTFFRVLMVLGGIGTVLTAGYLLWTIQRVNLGRVPDKFASGTGIHDVHPLEWYAWAPLLVLILAAGIFPKIVLDLTDDLGRVCRRDELTARECRGQVANDLSLPLRVQVQIDLVDQYDCFRLRGGISHLRVGLSKTPREV